MLRKISKWINKKIQKIRSKHFFHEYGYKLKNFDIEPYGLMEYAQWLHPYETEKEITKQLLQFYEQYIPKDSFAIDIGAHTGDTTVPMAVVAGSKGLVLGLEPNPYVFKILERNAQLNKNLAQIIPLCCAATSENGTFEFNYSDASFCNGGFLSKIQTKPHHHSHKLTVKGINLSTYLNENMKAYLPKLSFIKIDTEGYDKDVLLSLTNIITTYHPIIMSECYKRLTKEERFSLFNVFEDFGSYKLFKLDDNRHVSTIHISSGEMMLSEPHFNFVALPE